MPKFWARSEKYCIPPTARRSLSREMEMDGNQSAGNLSDLMDIWLCQAVPYYRLNLVLSERLHI